MSLHMVHQPHDLSEFMRRNPKKKPRLVRKTQKQVGRKFYNKSARRLQPSTTQHVDMGWQPLEHEMTINKDKSTPMAVYGRSSADGRYMQQKIRHYYHPKTRQHVIVQTFGNRYMQDMKTFKNQKAAHNHLKKLGIQRLMKINAPKRR